MAEFLGDIAGILEVFAVAAGLYVLHIGRREGAWLIKASGTVLLVGGIVLGLCTGYYWVRYAQQGAFAHSCPAHSQMMPMHGMMKMMHSGDKGPMMGGMKMGPERMRKHCEDLSPAECRAKMRSMMQERMGSPGTDTGGMPMRGDMPDDGPGMMGDN